MRPNDNVCIAQQGRELGNFSREQIARMLASGEIEQTAWFWIEGMAEWRPLANLALPPHKASNPPDDRTPLRSPLILVAGMRHCGSTALFNILRIGFLAAGHHVTSCYSESKRFADVMQSGDGVRLVKAHEVRPDLPAHSALVFTARRDLRDTVASAARRGFPLLAKSGTPVSYADYNRALHDAWQPRSHHTFIYEEFLEDPERVAGQALAAAGLPTRHAKTVYEEVRNLPTDDYQTTLLSPGHITDPDRRLTFQDTFSSADLDSIEKAHGDWLRQFGYRLDVVKN